ncbi:MAG: hypothetical protein ACMXYF_02890 [Candidatus Woesearchaeota archaeon]
MTTTPKRQIAKIVNIATLKNGEYIEREGWEPNVVKIANDEIGRVNIIGVLVEYIPGEVFSGMIDDGTQTIRLRSFDTIKEPFPLAVGATVLVIGRPRLYMNELYIVPEIVRKIDGKWLEIRKKETKHQKSEPQKTTVEKTDEPEEEPEKGDLQSLQGMLSLIDSLDGGKGVDVELLKEKVLEQEPEMDVQKRIERLLLNGEIFELKPGIIKVLK